MLFEITFKEGFKGGITDNNGAASCKFNFCRFKYAYFMKEKVRMRYK